MRKSAARGSDTQKIGDFWSTAMDEAKAEQKALGPLKPELDGLRDIGVRERVALAPIAALVIVLGLFPAPLLNVINPVVLGTSVCGTVKKPGPRPDPSRSSI